MTASSAPAQEADIQGGEIRGIKGARVHSRQVSPAGSSATPWTRPPSFAQLRASVLPTPLQAMRPAPAPPFHRGPLPDDDVPSVIDVAPSRPPLALVAHPIEPDDLSGPEQPEHEFPPPLPVPAARPRPRLPLPLSARPGGIIVRTPTPAPQPPVIGQPPLAPPAPQPPVPRASRSRRS